MHKIMKRLYLNVNSKYDPWQTTVSIIESLREFQISLPDHLRKEALNSLSNSTFKQQNIYLDFYFNHTLIICCRPLLVHRRGTSTPTAVAKHRRTYSQEIAASACRRIALGVDGARQCGFVAAMLFSVSGVSLNAAEILTLQAIGSPLDSDPAKEAYQLLEKLLKFLKDTPRPGPFTGQTMTVIDDLLHIVRAVNEKRRLRAVESTDNRDSSEILNLRTANRIEDTDTGLYSIFQSSLVKDFLDASLEFPSLAMDELIWMPGISPTIWGEDHSRQSNHC
jgi:hypothetical protein